MPPLMMVDDVLTIQKCSIESVRMNSVVNAFTERNKQKMSYNKCHKIHIDKKQKSPMCHDLQVHGEPMLNSKKEKYLGDIIVPGSSAKATIEDRLMKAEAKISQIIQLLREVTLGSYQLQM